jgi:hypothetical protein
MKHKIRYDVARGMGGARSGPDRRSGRNPRTARPREANAVQAGARPIRTALILVLICLALTACKTVKPHERVYLNDPEMQLGTSSVQGYERYIQSIREGAVPPGTSKSSGGCGCN